MTAASTSVATAPAASAAIPKADFDWKPLLILLGLIVLALPAIGSPSSWLTLTAAGIAMGLI
ncbi:MAG TPA: branched-chain amino acid ABC transporter permease, partial [Burkholderiaceae bacterium]|nr:branched-chain amino acid ABC transporter permease [Burkholderiaceae bacterium]